VTQAGLARFGDIQRTQVSLMLKTLEGKGLVDRARSPSDERAKRVEVTAAGLEALRLALPVVIEVQQRIFGEDGKTGGSLLAALLRLEAGGDRSKDRG
jgi:DNA-binding MarR family transcriptional regulator